MKDRIRNYLLHSPDAHSMIMLALLYLVIFLVFGLSNPNFLTLSNFSNIFKNGAELGIIGIGVSMVVIIGKIDLSISSTYCFAGLYFAIFLLRGIPFVAALLITLLLCVCFGIINAVFIGYMGLQPVLVTTGTQILGRGICYIGAGKSIQIRGMYEWFGNLGSMKIFGLFTVAFIIMIVMMIVQFFVLKRTRFGIMLLSIGNNPETTRLSGYNTKFYIGFVYVLNSIIAWVAGILMIARLQGVEPKYGTGYEFTALTIVLMGGIAFGGGKGNSIGLFLSTVAMAAVQNGMNLIKVSSLYQTAIIGVMVLVMIARPDFASMRAQAIAKRETRILNEKLKVQRTNSMQ